MVILNNIREYCSECHIRLDYLFFLLLIFVSIVRGGINVLSILLLLGILGVYRYNNYLSYTIALLYLILLFIGRTKKHKPIEKFEDSGNILLISKILEKSISDTENIITKYGIKRVDDLFNILSVLSAKEKKRLYAYAEMKKIYLLDTNKIITLIPIYHRGWKNIGDSLSSKEKFALDYYLKKKKPPSQYFKILEHLGLSKNLDSKLKNYNLGVEKEMYEIMILFDYYKLLETETRNVLAKKSEDIESGVDLWSYQALIKIIRSNWKDAVLVKYDVFNRAKEASEIIKKRSKKTVDSVDIDSKLDYSKIDKELDTDWKYKQYMNKYRKELYENEYKTIEVLNTLASKDDKDSAFLTDLISKLGVNFSNTILQVLEEIVSLFSEKFQGSVSEEKVFDNLWEKYIHYFKEIIKIMTSQGRLFYVGILIFMISILMYFAGMTK